MSNYCRQPQKPERKFKMTLIIGIICQDAIVLASETQTTAGSYRILDTQKIHRIAFNNGEAILAESGVVDSASVVIQKIKKDALEVKITDEETIPNFIQSKVREFRSDAISLHPNAGLIEWQNFFYSDNNSFNLTFAYYHGEKPFLYNIEPAKAKASRLPGRHYSASGIGAELGTYLLREHSKPNMPYWQAAYVASHVVETVKDHVEGCGGKTQIGVIRSHGQMYEPIGGIDICLLGNDYVCFDSGEYVYFFTEKYVNQMAESNVKLNFQLRNKRNQEIMSILYLEAKEVSSRMTEAMNLLFQKWKTEGLK
jgi:20S proteasome alpha/beta subunit